MIQILKKKRNTETSWKNKNGDFDSDDSVKKSIPLKNYKRCILASDHDDKDSPPKKKQDDKGTHWLQDKIRIVLEMNGINWHDYFKMDNFS